VVFGVLPHGIWKLADVQILSEMLVSMQITSNALREVNGFAWGGAMAEVATLFAAIFLVPLLVLATLTFFWGRGGSKLAPSKRKAITRCPM